MVTMLVVGYGEGRAHEVGHQGTVSALTLSRDAHWLLSAGYDGTVRLWNLRYRGDMEFLLDRRKSFVDFTDAHPPREFHAVAIDPQGHWAAAGSRDRRVRIWNLETRELRVLHGHETRVLSVAFSPDSTLLASGEGGGLVLVWDVRTGEQVHILLQEFKEEFHEEGRRKVGGLVHGLVFTPDGQTLLSGDMDGVVSFWNLNTGKLDRHLELPCTFIYSLAVSQSPLRIAAGCMGKAIIWNAAEGSQTILSHDDRHSVRSVAISPDGAVVVTGDSQSTVRLWDMETGTERAHFLIDFGEVRSVLLSADQKTVFAAGDVGHLSMWQIEQNTVHRLSPVESH